MADRRNSWADVLAAAGPDVQASTVGLLDASELSDLVDCAGELHPQVVERALDGGELNVLWGLVRREDLTVETYERLAKDRRKTLMLRFARNPAVPASALEELVRGNEPDVNAEVWANPNSTAGLRRAILSGRSINPRTPQRKVGVPWPVITDALENHREAALSSLCPAVLLRALEEAASFTGGERQQLLAAVAAAGLDPDTGDSDRRQLRSTLRRWAEKFGEAVQVVVQRAEGASDVELFEEILGLQQVSDTASAGPARPVEDAEVLAQLRAGVRPGRFASGPLPWEQIVEQCRQYPDRTWQVLADRDDAPDAFVERTRWERAHLYVRRPQVDRDEVVRVLARSMCDGVTRSELVVACFGRFELSVEELAPHLPSRAAPLLLRFCEPHLSSRDLAEWVGRRFAGSPQAWPTFLQLLDSHNGSLAELVDAAAALHQLETS